MQRGFAPGFVD